ncbi:hypothetical protein [Thermococcus sp. JCM 11816]|uniref:hypothetical protein n=1 Tax=Thermococcus sp. (strain JCM 11816 / KS-1) TaxID=1295125 RepID=UPI000A494B1B
MGKEGNHSFFASFWFLNSGHQAFSPEEAHEAGPMKYTAITAVRRIPAERAKPISLVPPHVELSIKLRRCWPGRLQGL